MEIDTHSPLFVDHYGRNRATGCFILIDPISNLTLAAGMVTGRDPRLADALAETIFDVTDVSRVPTAERGTTHRARSGSDMVERWDRDCLRGRSRTFRRGLLTHVIAPQTDGSMLLELARNSLAAGLVTICPAGLFFEVERRRAQELVPDEHLSTSMHPREPKAWRR